MNLTKLTYKKHPTKGLLFKLIRSVKYKYGKIKKGDIGIFIDHIYRETPGFRFQTKILIGKEIIFINFDIQYFSRYFKFLDL